MSIVAPSNSTPNRPYCLQPYSRELPLGTLLFKSHQDLSRGNQAEALRYRETRPHMSLVYFISEPQVRERIDETFPNKGSGPDSGGQAPWRPTLTRSSGRHSITYSDFGHPRGNRRQHSTVGRRGFPETSERALPRPSRGRTASHRTRSAATRCLSC